MWSRSNRYTREYGGLWHVFDIIFGFICGVIFAAVVEGFSLATTIGLFFAVWFICYLMAFVFTYGVVRTKGKHARKY